MLKAETPYPYVGSYGLLVDMDEPAPQSCELVRILWRREDHVAVSFPLRDDARGTKRVDPADLIDATALNDVERAEMFELERMLAHGTLRSKTQQRQRARRDALRRRNIHAPILKRLLRDAAARAAFCEAA